MPIYTLIDGTSELAWGELARIIHRFLSRGVGSAAMTRRATKGPAGVLVQYAEEPEAAQHSQRG